jgi:hypothetical protein
MDDHSTHVPGGMKNCDMSKTVFEQISGDLVDGANVQTVQLCLTICEQSGSIDRALAKIELARGHATQDGNYTLRYRWNGRLEEDRVQIKYGVLIAG